MSTLRKKNGYNNITVQTAYGNLPNKRILSEFPFVNTLRRGDNRIAACHHRTPTVDCHIDMLLDHSYCSYYNYIATIRLP